MMEWLLIFVGGLLGSSHCVGMCGGFALLLGTNQRSLTVNLARQCTYSLGRAFTYTVGGAVAGYGGWRLTIGPWSPVNIQAALAILAGVLLIVQGLLATGMLPRFWRTSAHTGCPGAASLRMLLTGSGLHNVFLAGLANGLLPCGLVYAYLALAGVSGGIFRGMATMFFFGLGTIPAMVLVGSGGTLLSLTARRHLFRLAAWCVVLTGLISISRGAHFLRFTDFETPPICPNCDVTETLTSRPAGGS
jgi:sulfite exporter TauE/SafE